MTFWEKLSFSLPIYVTRTTAKGETAEYAMNIWFTLSAMFFILTNIWLWGIVGIITAIKVLF